MFLVVPSRSSSAVYFQSSFHPHRYRNCYFAAASVFEADVSAPPISKKPPTIPPLASTPPLRVLLIVEPTPFTYISGYANRFKVIHSSFYLYYTYVFIHVCIMLTLYTYIHVLQEMLKYLKKAGDEVHVFTPDCDLANAPSDFLGFPITNVRGFSFPLYKQVQY